MKSIIKITDMKTLEERFVSFHQMRSSLRMRFAHWLRNEALRKSPDGKVPGFGFYLRYANQFYR